MQGAMPPPLAADRFERDDSGIGRVACYGAVPTGSAQPPLLLVHSVNAAATAYEMKPLFEHYRAIRPVYALDLPGFGLSDRSDRPYTPRLMTDAVLRLVADIRRTHADAPINVIALSLGCEFAARAAPEAVNSFRSVALISPTGLDRRSAA